MFGLGKKKAPLYTLLQPLEESYTFIIEKLSEYMESGGLSLDNLGDGNILKLYIEPQAFSYVILIWGINASRLDKSEKQFLCSSITKVIGQKISSYSEDDGANYLRDSLLAYGREGQNGPSDQLTRRVTFRFMAEMEVDPMEHMAAFGAISINLKSLIEFTAGFLNEQQKQFKFV